MRDSHRRHRPRALQNQRAPQFRHLGRPHLPPAERIEIPPRAHMGDRLSELILERGWSQKYLADRLGWSRATMSFKFAGAKWDADTIWAIANATDVPTDYFFRDPQHQAPEQEHRL